MSQDEAIMYDKYEVQSLLGLDHTSEFKLERIFGMYKNYGGKHFFYNLLKKIEFPEKVNKTAYNMYYAGPNDVWTLISHKFYKRIDLWWVIAMFNDLDDAFTPPIPGQAIKVPTPEYIRLILDAIKTQV